MTDEPRYTIRTWFDTVGGKVTAANLAKRDATLASFEAQFEMTETDLKYLFATAGLDIIFIVKKMAPSVEPIFRGRTTIGHRHFIGIQPVVVNKFSDGALNVEGSELLGKALAEIRRIIAAEIDTGGTIVLAQEQPSIERIGSTLLFGDTVIIRFSQFT